MATYSSKKYPSGSVTSAQLADGTVVAVDLADGAVTSAKLNSTVDLSGKTVTYRSIVAGDIASGAITTAKIADGAVVTADLAANAVTPAKMSNSGLELGMRNAFINGNFDIWQRSTSATHTGIWSVVSADRWGGHFDGGTAGTYSRSTNVPNSNSLYSMRVTGASGGTSAYLDQRIEAVNIRPMINAGSVTVSGWVRRVGTPAATISLNLITPTALDDYTSYNTIGAIFSDNNTISGNGTVSASTMTLTTPNTWYYFTMTDTSWASRTDITKGAQIYFALSSLSSTGNYYEFSQLQIEAGPAATPFEFRHAGTELELCQRYFCNTFKSHGKWHSSTMMRVMAALPVTMRTFPSIAVNNSSSLYYESWNASGYNGTNTESITYSSPSLSTMDYQLTVPNNSVSAGSFAMISNNISAIAEL